LWNHVDAAQKHLKKDHVHMHIWMRVAEEQPLAEANARLEIK